MITTVVQRWRQGRDSYRPAREVIDPRRYEVVQLPADNAVKPFVEAHHYSGSYPAARYRFGLYERGILVGVAVFSHPVNDRVLDALPCPREEGVELGRLVLLDDVPANAESWFIARCFEGLRREGIAGVISFSDPLPRTSAEGRVVFGGHIGVVYQASNAVYLGRATPRTLRILPDGAVLSERALSKIRAQERGHEYAEALLERAGAAPRRGEDPRRWLATWLPRITRTTRHPGNHKYAFSLSRSVRKLLPTSLAYPKFLGVAA